MNMSGRSSVRLRYSPPSPTIALATVGFFLSGFGGHSPLIFRFHFSAFSPQELAQLARASRHEYVGKVVGSTPIFSTFAHHSFSDGGFLFIGLRWTQSTDFSVPLFRLQSTRISSAG